jgi:SAM-dependent methyltransferase
MTAGCRVMSGGATYDRIGVGYTSVRRADPRIDARIRAAVGKAERIVNVGAGTGSYEPDNRVVAAVEPSSEMIEQRSPRSAPAVRAIAEELPFPDGAFDAALAILTVHHWSALRPASPRSGG